MANTDKETAEVLCTLFQNVFVNETAVKDISHDAEVKESVNWSVQFDESIVLEKLQKLKPDKSQKPDEIHPMVLLRTAVVVASHCQSFLKHHTAREYCLLTGSVPTFPLSSRKVANPM